MVPLIMTSNIVSVRTEYHYDFGYFLTETLYGFVICTVNL